MRVLEEIMTYKAAIAATKTKDTIKVVNEAGEVDFTPNRDFVYNIQTPQAFDTRLIKAFTKSISNQKPKSLTTANFLSFLTERNLSRWLKVNIPTSR